MSDLPDYSSSSSEDDNAASAPPPPPPRPNPYQDHSIFWVVQRGDLQELNALFNGGHANPDELRKGCYYISPILRSRMEDILVGPGRISPNLAREYLRENTLIERMPEVPGREDTFEDRRRVTKGKLQMRPPVRGFCWSHDIMGKKILGKPVKGPPLSWAHWYGASWWGPLHLAAFLGHTQLVDKLLDENHDIEDLCRGLCDCLMPSHLLDTPSGKEDKVGGTLSDPRPDWTPLHYAICGGHLETARRLVERGASKMVGRPFSARNWPAPSSTPPPAPAAVPDPAAAPVGAIVATAAAAATATAAARSLPSPTAQSHIPSWERPTWPALHSAARAGSAPMCAYLLAAFPGTINDEARVWRHGGSARFADTAPPIRSTALVQAAAAGHIRTAGKYLLERGARFAMKGYNVQELRDPLRVLCALGRLDDAVWLADFLLVLEVEARRPHVEGPARHFRRSVTACLAILRKRRTGAGLLGSPGDWAWASARERQDRWCPEIAGLGLAAGGPVDSGARTERDVEDHLRTVVLPRLKELGG